MIKKCISLDDTINNGTTYFFEKRLSSLQISGDVSI